MESNDAPVDSNAAPGEPRIDSHHRRVRAGWIVTAIGGAVMLWGVLYMTSHAIGGHVDDFAHRRTYNETKLAAHMAYPGFLWRAACGMLLVWAGARLRKTDDAR